MKNLKKTLSFALLLAFCCTMLVFGCTDKYSNLKITTDAPEEGITLYLDKDTETEKPSEATFVATVSGANEDVSTELKHSFSKENLVDIDMKTEGADTTITLKARNIGSTTLTLLTKEGNKSISINIKVVWELEQLNVNSSYKPFVFVGSTSTIDTSQAIIYEPKETSQKQVTYSMVGSYANVVVEENGRIIAPQDTPSGTFNVIATSVDNSTISTEQIEVRVFKPILEEDVEFVTSDNNEQLVLSTSVLPDEVTKILTLNVNTSENYIIQSPVCESQTSNLVEIEQIDNNNFKITGLNVGFGTLKFGIMLSDGESLYQNTTVTVSKDVTVKQYATEVLINGSSEEVENIKLYDNYQNQRGQTFKIEVGQQNAEDKRFVVALSEEDIDKITIVDSTNKEIKLYSETATDYDILQSGATIFARIKSGYLLESTAKIDIIAYGTLGLLCQPVSNSIVANLKHGVNTLSTESTLTLHEERYLLATGEQNKTIVSVVVPQNQYTSYILAKSTDKNISFKQKIDIEDARTQQNNTVFDFELTAVAEGICELEFFAENGVSTKIAIRTFNKINAFQITSQTVNENSKIGLVEYNNKSMTIGGNEVGRNSLSKIAISYGGEVKLGVNLLYFDGTKAYNVETKYLIERSITPNNCYTLLQNNTLVAKSITSQPQIATITVKVYDDELGVITLPEQQIEITIYYEISEIFLNKANVELYTRDGLATADVDRSVSEFEVKYRRGTEEVIIPADKITWQISGQNRYNIQQDPDNPNKITATSLPEGMDSGIAIITAIYTEYGRTYIAEASIVIRKTVQVDNIYNITYQKDGKSTLLSKQYVIVGEDDNGLPQYSDEECYFIYLDARKGAEKGATFSISQSVSPANAYDTTIIYSTKNNIETEIIPVLTIDENGLVTINRTSGTAWIYLSAKTSAVDGEYLVQRKIFVKIADGSSSVTSLEISNEYDLLEINNSKSSLGKFYQLTKDINMSNVSANWTPIGIIDGEIVGFSGHLNGKIISKGETYICTISGFNLNVSSSSSTVYSGLFATVTEDAVIENVNISVNKVQINLTASDASSEFVFGGLCAKSEGKIKNVSISFTDAQITECAYNSNIGGLVGINDGEILQCYTSGNLYHSKQNSLRTSYTAIGGLVGTNNSKIDGNSHLVNNKNFDDAYTSLINLDCCFYNAENNKTYSEFAGFVSVGGVVGQNNKDVSNCSFDGNIVAINNVGGVVGKNTSNLKGCFSSGRISGFNNVGGIVGSTTDTSTIDFCAVNMFDTYAVDYQETIQPSITGHYDNIGGLVGYAEGAIITNSFVKTYFVRETSNYVGDLFVKFGAYANNVGGLIGYASNVTVEKCYSQININSSEMASFVGGLIGGADSATINNCYTRGTIILADSQDSVAGKIVGLLHSNSSITNCYSTIVDEDIKQDATSNTAFVGKKDSFNLSIANSYHLSSSSDGYSKTSDDLKLLSTYEGNWQISTTISNDGVWYINEGSNNGYPMLICNSTKLGVEAPTQVKLMLNENNNVYKLDDSTAIVWKFSNSITIPLVGTNGLFNSIKITPEDAGNAFVVTSSDESILKITGRNKDRLLPVLNGQVTLTITSKLNNTVSASVTIYVVNKIENFSIGNVSDGVSSLVNQKHNVELSADNTSNYKLKIKIEGGNNQYILVNNQTIDADGYIYLDYTSRLYVYSIKSVATPATITITPYIVVNGKEIMPLSDGLSFEYTSYYGIKSFTCNLNQINITSSDSARLVYTAIGDDLRVNESSLPQLNKTIYLAGKLVESDLLKIGDPNIVAYDADGNIVNDFSSVAIVKIVYECILTVDKANFKQGTAFDICAKISLSDTETEGTYAEAFTNAVVTKEPLKNISIDFYTDSQKTTDKNGNLAYTVAEASSHKIVAGKTGLLKISMYPSTADVKEVRVYNMGGSTQKINFAQLLKYTGDGNAITYYDRKPYANNIVDKNGIILWQESNYVSDKTVSYDGFFYVALLIPSSVTAGTTYTICVEADMADGRTLIQTYELYSDIPSEVSISYNFENMQTITDKANIAYNVEQTLLIEVAKITVLELSDKTGIEGLEIVCDNVQFTYDSAHSVLNSYGFSYLRYNFTISDTSIKQFEVVVKMTKTINNQETTFISNNLIFNVRDFVVKSVDIVTDSTDSDVLSLATNTSQQLQVKLDCQYNKTDDDTDDDIVAKIKDLETKISNSFEESSNKLDYWFTKQPFTAQLENLELKSYTNYKIVMASDENGESLFKIQPIRESSGDQIYFAVGLNYEGGNEKIEIEPYNIVDSGVAKSAGFNGKEQVLISSISTKFYRDVSAKNAIPVGNLQDETSNKNENSNGDDQSNTKSGEISFVEMGNGTEGNVLYYRLKENITLTDYTPMNLSYISIDGNGYTVTIESFSEEAILSGNLGLFETTDNNTIIQNLSVKYTSNEQLNFTKTSIESLNFGGFVTTNAGIIYNCNSSGSIEITTLANNETGIPVYVGGLCSANSGYVSFSQSSLQITINRGVVGGFVAQNYGTISNSKVIFENTGISNSATNELNTKVGGFVARNSGKIYGSYIAGTTRIKGTDENDTERYADQISSYTPIGGFAYENIGEIYNSYSNITVECQTRSSGFAYINEGTIQSCYSASKMREYSTVHNPFIGVGESGVNNKGTVTDCYYLKDNFGSTSQDPAQKLDTLTEISNFAEFIFADDGKLNGTWHMGTYGPTLVDADLILEYKQNYKGIVIDDSGSTYSWAYMDGSPTSGKTTDDGKYNLRIITSAQDFNETITKGTSENGMDSTLKDNFVILKDITFESYSLPNTSELQFKGNLFGNNMTLANVYLKASNSNNNPYFGLFGELDGAVVKDIAIKAKQCVANNTSYVGILAGDIKESNVSNISIDGSNVYVQGKYFVGGIAGYVSDSSIRKVSVSTTVNASYRGVEEYAKVFENITDSNTYDFTYSGIAVGVLTGSSCLQNVTVSGVCMSIGYFASACVGLVDSGSVLSMAKVELSSQQYVRAYYVAGGVVAENRGLVERCSIEHNQTTQNAIDANFNDYTSGRNLTFFAGSPYVIGGLVGFNNGGDVMYSYSKLDVRASTLATKVAGGLIGTIVAGNVAGCYATGSVLSYKVLGGLIGSITTKQSLSYNKDDEILNKSAVFISGQDKIENGDVSIDTVFASNKWLTGSDYDDLDIISASFSSGMLVGCLNPLKNGESYSQLKDNVSVTNAYINTQITENTIKNPIDNYIPKNGVLTAFNGGSDALTSADEIVNLTYGKVTTNFDGTASGMTDTSLPDAQIKNEGTYITFYFISINEANMNVIAGNETIAKYLNAPTTSSLYPTIIKNMNLAVKQPR